MMLNGSINYTHFIPATYYGVHISPGDVWEVNSGLGFAVNDTSTFTMTWYDRRPLVAASKGAG